MAYQLLSVGSDAKTRKGEAAGYLTGILYGAPATEADGVHDLCPMATDECRRACLYDSGMAQVFPAIKAARIAKTLEYIADPKAFEEKLAQDIIQLQHEAAKRGLLPAVRINGTFDQPKLARSLARRFPNVQFYDYTKIEKPWQRTLPNYSLTFSFSGENMAHCLKALSCGINVSVVFAGELPATWHGIPVIDGDKNDLRFLDPQGVIVGLSVKPNAGTRTMATGGFIQIGA